MCRKAGIALIYWGSMLVAMAVAVGAGTLRATRVGQKGGVLVPDAAVVAKW